MRECTARKVTIWEWLPLGEVATSASPHEVGKRWSGSSHQLLDTEVYCRADFSLLHKANEERTDHWGIWQLIHHLKSLGDTLLSFYNMKPSFSGLPTGCKALNCGRQARFRWSSRSILPSTFMDISSGPLVLGSQLERCRVEEAAERLSIFLLQVAGSSPQQKAFWLSQLAGP